MQKQAQPSNTNHAAHHGLRPDADEAEPSGRWRTASLAAAPGFRLDSQDGRAPGAGQARVRGHPSHHESLSKNPRGPGAGAGTHVGMHAGRSSEASYAEARGRRGGPTSRSSRRPAAETTAATRRAPPSGGRRGAHGVSPRRTRELAARVGRISGEIMRHTLESVKGCVVCIFRRAPGSPRRDAVVWGRFAKVPTDTSRSRGRGASSTRTLRAILWGDCNAHVLGRRMRERFLSSTAFCGAGIPVRGHGSTGTQPEHNESGNRARAGAVCDVARALNEGVVAQVECMQSGVLRATETRWK